MEPALPVRETVDLRSYARLLLRRKWIVIVPTLLAAVTAVVVTLPAIMKPIYQSSSALMVEFPRPLSRDLANLVAAPSVEEQVARLESMIQSNEFLTKMIINTGLRDDPSVQTWARRNQKRYPELSMQELTDLKLIEYLRGTIRMSGQSGRYRGSTNIIQVAVQDYYPERARRLVQNITAGIIEANRSEQLRQIKSTGDFSATQLQEYQAKVQEAEERLDQYKREQLRRRTSLGLVRDENVTAVRELRLNASNDLERRDAEVQDAAAALRRAGVDPAKLDPMLKAAPARDGLRDLRSMEGDYVRQMVVAVGAASVPRPTAILQERKLEETTQALKREIEKRDDVPAAAREAAADYLRASLRRDVARTRVDAYDGHLREYTDFLASLPEVDSEFQRLQREVDSYKTLQNTFLQQVASSQISEAFGTSKVGEKISILEPAQHPLKPIRPKRVQIIFVSIIAGLLVGITGAFFVEQHDPSYKDVRELEKQLGVPVLATLPHLKEVESLSRGGHGRGGPLRTASVERAVDRFLDDSPGYQEFRKAVLGMFRSGDAAPRTIMVTSAHKGEGKSTSAACLALALAKERPQERVVLCDLDLRNASLGSLFGINGGAGEGRISLAMKHWADDRLAELPLPNLRLLDLKAAGATATDSLTAENLDWLLQRLRASADRIIVDTPPNLAIPDALVVGQLADAVVMVVKAGSTPRESVRRGLELQRQFSNNVRGIILNDTSAVLPYYYSPKYYGRNYARTS